MTWFRAIMLASPLGRLRLDPPLSRGVGFCQHSSLHPSVMRSLLPKQVLSSVTAARLGDVTSHTMGWMVPSSLKAVASYPHGQNILSRYALLNVTCAEFWPDLSFVAFHFSIMRLRPASTATESWSFSAPLTSII